jgi:hypothetical protein
VQSKLTLRLDEALIRRAKVIAKRKGKSVSQMVAEYFALLESRSSKEAEELAPAVKSLKGMLKGSQLDREDYRPHLEDKYL